MSDHRLAMWTVYDHPTDFPNNFVARRFEIGSGPEPVATQSFIICPDLAALREQLLQMGLTPIMRADEDGPRIVECWL